jgi:hypothetical protein
MAKRKPARRRRPAPGAAKRARRPVSARTPARKARPARKTTAKRSAPAAGARRTAKPKAKPSRAKPASRSKTARSKTTPVKAKARVARPAAKRPAKQTAPRRAPAPAKVARKTPAAPARKLLAPDLTKRKRVLDLDRDRRRVQEDDEIASPTPPSSLGLDRTASAARSGRQELRERYDQHTETSPTLTGGDVDADWESAYSVGDEAPGGDNPTPDQNVVDDIGAAVGVEYDDNEELEGADRIVERDRHRWEFDPASSDDFDER